MWMGCTCDLLLTHAMCECFVICHSQ